MSCSAGDGEGGDNHREWTSHAEALTCHPQLSCRHQPFLLGRLEPQHPLPIYSPMTCYIPSSPTSLGSPLQRM